MNACCPICEASTYQYLFKVLPQCEHGSIVRCSRCAHCYSLMAANVDAAALYSDEVYQVVENRQSIFDRILNWEYGHVLEQLARLRPAKGRLLDFGGGKGKFGWLAREAGWDPRCVETSAARAAYAREVYGLDVDTNFYERGALFGGHFDVVTLFHVLEHLPHPQALLGELVAANLKRDGLLVIEVPNITSWQAWLAGNRWMHLDVPRHIQHFSPQRLARLLGDMGFRPLRTTYASVHLGVLGMLDSLMKRFGYGGNIIYELKNRRTPALLAKVALALPFAALLEGVASLLGKGGVIRMYLVRTGAQAPGPGESTGPF